MPATTQTETCKLTVVQQWAQASSSWGRDRDTLRCRCVAQEVYSAFMRQGQAGAHRAYAQLPHTEAGFRDTSRFAAVA